MATSQSPGGREQDTQLVLRLPTALMAALDGYRDKLRASSPPGVTLTRSDAARALLLAGLATVERPARKGAK
jgi:hypothetical protein